MVHIGLSVVLALAISQAAPNPPARISDFSRRLSNQVVAEIEQAITSAAGKPSKPWLLIGGEGPKGNSVVQAYLAEESTTAEFRRSTKVILTHPSNGVPWAVEFLDAKASGYYAQVAVPGRSLDSITGDRDINQPFGVVGSFQDSELIAIVTLIRSNPPSPNGGLVPGDWPIAQISRAPDGSANVSLRGSNEYSGKSANLTGERGVWHITRTWQWVD